MLQIDVGDTSAAAPDMVPIAVSPGDSITISNLAGATLNVFTNGIDGAPSTLTPTNNVTVTVPTWIQSQGVTTVKITGGQYGAG